MEHRTDFYIAGLIALAIVADVVLNQSNGVLFLLRKLADLIEYLAIWR